MTNLVRTLFLLVAFVLATCSAEISNNYRSTASAQTSVSDLLEQMKTAQGDDLMRVIDALGQSHDRRAVEPLLVIFDVPRTAMPQLRRIVVALGKLRDARALPALSDAWIYLKTNEGVLGDKQYPRVWVAYEMLCEAIVDASGEIGGNVAIEILVSATRDSEERVVEHACRALTHLNYNTAGLNCSPSR